MTHDTDRPQAEALARARYRAALGSTIVAAVFCLVVGGILVGAYLERARVGLDKSEELNNLRSALLKVSDPEVRQAVLEDLRRRDLALRGEFFGGQAFQRRGGYLLLGGLIVFILAAAMVAACHKRLPMPEPASGRPRGPGPAGPARWSVAGIGAALVLAALVAMGLYGSGPDAPAPTQGNGEQPVAQVPPPPGPEEIRKHWPRFRGPGGLGVSAYTNVPVAWNGKTGQNILWKVPVPLSAPNSPVVWGDRLFLTGATDEKREVYCFSTADGKILWQQEVSTPAGGVAEPPEILEDTTFAAPTAATDGRYVCAIFANGDIACFGTDGHPVWTQNLGRFKNSYGYASSLALYGNTVLVLLDQGTPGKTDSRLLALDLATGKTAWQTERPVPASWATPILYHTGKREEFVAAAKPWLIAYNPADGKELWRAKVLDGDVAPSPIYAGGMVYAVNAGSQLSAVRTDGAGDVTQTGVAWTAEDGLPDIASPISDGQVVLLVTTDGLLTFYNAADGKLAWEQEIDDIFMSSPTLVGDKVYLMTEKGVMHIFTMKGKFEAVGQADLGERSICSPAFLDGRIYIRGKQHLYAIGKKDGPAPADPGGMPAQP